MIWRDAPYRPGGSLMTIEVRQFRRDDREQLASLVNAHVGSVVPGMSVSVNRVLTHLEREPGEFIVDPWVVERITLVAVQRERIAAAAHLHRYGSQPPVEESYRDAGGIHWFICWPNSRYWPAASDAADALLRACVAQLDQWGTSRQFADGSLPAPGVYGIPAQWPHVEAALRRASFEHQGRVELIFVRDLDDVREDPPLPRGLSVRRSLGGNGTRLAASLGETEVGFIEVETLGDAERLSRSAAWGDIGNLFVDEQFRRRRIATALIQEAARWLRLAHVDRLLAYATPEDEAAISCYAANGFAELTLTRRGWVRPVVNVRRTLRS
jgi:GNAT superfamily N-acetyltransferase